MIWGGVHTQLPSDMSFSCFLFGSGCEGQRGRGGSAGKELAWMERKERQRGSTVRTVHAVYERTLDPYAWEVLGQLRHERLNLRNQAAETKRCHLARSPMSDRQRLSRPPNEANSLRNKKHSLMRLCCDIETKHGRSSAYAQIICLVGHQTRPGSATLGACRLGLCVHLVAAIPPSCFVKRSP